ncbi:MAG: hypothetical protein H3Z53_05525 [archaeon]|nr:hypothetical protein [archaeon]
MIRGRSVCYGSCEAVKKNCYCYAGAKIAAEDDTSFSDLLLERDQKKDTFKIIAHSDAPGLLSGWTPHFAAISALWGRGHSAPHLACSVT